MPFKGAGLAGMVMKAPEGVKPKDSVSRGKGHPHDPIIK